MKMLDTNLLLYAINKDFPQHQAAKNWFEHTMAEDCLISMPWVVILAFLRISTSPKIFRTPMDIETAQSYVDSWDQRKNVEFTTPGKSHWTLLSNLLSQCGTGGNLTTDAHIAAMAIEKGFTVYSADNDFKRFSGITHINPLQC